jgi:pseudomonalisin
MSKHLSSVLAVFCLLLALLSARAQQADRVAARPEFTPSVRLAGHLPRWANAANDAGPVAGETNLHLTFVLSRAPEQEAAFMQLLADQQDPASARYHQWLTPQQAGDLYGPTQHDIDAFAAWLAGRGFGVVEVSPSHLFINVDAPAAAVAGALSTSFRYFILNGEPRISTTQEPALPGAFAGIVGAIAGLADTPIEPMGHGEGVASGGGGPQPRFDYNTSHYITPGDFAKIFDLTAPYGNGLTGVGQRIAIIGRSRVVPTDITEFESNTGLAANVPTVVIPNAVYDPGYAGNGDESEATLDVSRVMGTAPSAQVDLVVLSSAGGGILSAAQYAVNTLNDAIMNVSFGSCEVTQGLAGVKSWDTLFSQAASQGISVFVSASDSGAATCDAQFATPPVTQVRSINYICASSYATCVGGTELADTASPSSYWSSSNGANLTSALGYIPEGAWNEPTVTNSGVVTYVAASGGGGASLYITKPSWQTGVGVPADGARDVPDVSFPAAGHDGYYACYALNAGNCGVGQFEYFYGTSAAAPSMAAVTAMVNQRTGVRQGNLNPTLYRLAANPANNVFHDTTIASSGVANCSVLTASMCNNSTPSPTALTGGLAGYLLTAGYDQATGWGSVDVGNLLSTLGTAQAVTTATLSESASSILVGASVTFTVKVSSTSAGVPTGFVQFFSNSVTLGPAVSVPTSGIAVTAAIPFTTVATNFITAVYSGDANFAVATATGLTLDVHKPPTTTTISPASMTITTLNQIGYTVTVAGAVGFPTGTVQFSQSGPNGSGPIGQLVYLTGGAGTLPALSLSQGTYVITAAYLGDAIYAASSGTASLIVLGVPTVNTLTALAATATPQQTVTFSSSVTGSGGTPSSTVQLLLDGSTWGPGVTLAGGAATFAPTTIPLGVHTVTSRYGGDSIYAASVSNGLTYTVSGFSLSASPGSLTLSAGATTGNSATLTYTSVAGFAGTINQSCAITQTGSSAANYSPTCSFSSPTVTLAAGGSATGTISISSVIPKVVHGGAAAREIALGLLMMAWLPGRRRFARRRLRRSVGLSFAVGLALCLRLGSLAGCGGGGSGSGGTSTPPGPGSYVITLTSSSGSTTASPAITMPLVIQ